MAFTLRLSPGDRRFPCTAGWRMLNGISRRTTVVVPWNRLLPNRQPEAAELEAEDATAS